MSIFKKAQSIFNYFLLALIFIPSWIYKINSSEKLLKKIRKNWWKYFLVSFADVEAQQLEELLLQSRHSGRQQRELWEGEPAEGDGIECNRIAGRFHTIDATHG